MEAHVQVLPRLRIHMLRERSGMFAVVAQEVILVPGGLLRLYWYRGPEGGNERLAYDVEVDPRVLAVAVGIARRKASGLAIPRVAVPGVSRG